MPPIGLLIGQVDFSDLKLVLKPADEAAKTPEVAIAYGAFVNSIIQFVIVAFAVFVVVKLVNSMRRAGSRRAGRAARADAERGAADRNPRPAEEKA